MYEINLLEDKDYYDYYYTSKNEKGQIITLNITSETLNRSIKYYIGFYIGKRKKGFQYMAATGKDGIKSLVWAKNCIKNFIESLQCHHRFSMYEEHYIIVQWDDNKRRNAYERGLKPLGFYYGVDYLKKSLIYKFKK